MRKNLYRADDSKRIVPIRRRQDTPSERYRNSWRRDYARLIHSAAFRRLQGKTQLFPNHESDFFRNRLTHSLEVAQVAKSIATRLNATESAFKNNKIETDVVEVAALAHDLGHPPFGHNGEEALDECMSNAGGFEGNAQTLRILTKIEKRQTKEFQNSQYIPVDENGVDQRAGLNLSFRTLAAILKYDVEIPQQRKERTNKKGVTKGYYRTEREIVRSVKKHVLGDDKFRGNFKTLECSIMDVADDIAYSTYDLEDAFKANFLTPIQMISASDELLHKVCKKVEASIQDSFPNLPTSKQKFNEDDTRNVLVRLFGGILNLGEIGLPKDEEIVVDFVWRAFLSAHVQRTSESFASNGYFRTELTSQLVGRFIRGVEIEINNDFPPLSKAFLSLEILKEVEVLKHFVYQSLIMSPMLKVAEYRGKQIVKEIFEALLLDKGNLLLPDDYRNLYSDLDDTAGKRRVICDFIAGMTDRYALEFHKRLFSENSETIFKPL